jgi:hypothetical protein
MPDIDLAKLSERVKDSTKPIKRTFTRTTKPNPLQPLLAESWEHRTPRENAKTEVGRTREIRTYSADETTAVVRALRRAGETLNVGVTIEAPEESYTVPVMAEDDDGNPVKDEEGNPVQATDEDGNPLVRERTRFKAGTVKFEAVTRQKRSRKDNGNQADESEQATTGGVEGEPDQHQQDEANWPQ